MSRALQLAMLGALLVTSCGNDNVTVEVFAASSLTDAFTELEERFEAENPGVDIRLNLAGSDTLRRQINDGAGADVFAPASIDLFDGIDVTPSTYATNVLEVIVSADLSVDDLTDPDGFDGLIVARCDSGVPCGIAADALIDALGLDLSGATITSETNVRAVLSKVELGEADVGFVYRTDALAGSDHIVVTGLTAPDAAVTLAVAALDPGATDASRFVDFVVSPESADVLAALGFTPAP